MPIFRSLPLGSADAWVGQPNRTGRHLTGHADAADAASAGNGGGDTEPAAAGGSDVARVPGGGAGGVGE